jgi:LysR family glycine cleavage system transcriptional activator
MARGRGAAWSWSICWKTNSSPAGTGVALGRTSLVAADIQAGRLIRPFGPAQHTSLAYFAVRLESVRPSGAVAAFMRWLHEEAAAG